MTHPHPIVITCDGTDVDWTHPDDCPDGQHCDILRRTSRMRIDNMALLVEGRPDGTYLLGMYGFHGLCLIDETGLMLPDIAPPTAA